MSLRTTRARRHLVAAVLGGVVLAIWRAGPTARAESADVPARGELLYVTHCIECHDEQIHWRERRSARDWATLRDQVDRWQQAGHLAWTEQDVDAVTHYLNDTVYHFPAPHTQARHAAGRGPGRSAAP